MDHASRLRSAYRAVVLLGGICIGLVVACVVLWQRSGESPPIDSALASLDDPRVREAAVAKLVSSGAGGWDSFPDPDVGRVFQPGLKDGRMSGVLVSTNAQGLREGPVAMPKPKGTTRIVLLGDSFVMGEGAKTEDRLGVFLAQMLREKSSGASGPIECLHFGLDNWNIVAESSFLRRQLSLVAPDLVVHVIIRNDMEDNVGARGFGGMSSFSPLHPERGDGVFQARVPSVSFGNRQMNWIAHGLDWESRTRFEEAGRRVVDLARRIEEAGGRYLLLDYYAGLLPASRQFITSKLRPEQVAYLPTDLFQDDRFRISSENTHWNRAGHELVASLLYSAIRARKLLPALTLAEWPEADAAAKEWFEDGEREAGKPLRLDKPPGHRKIRAELDLRSLDDESASQVTGGIFRGGEVGPYAAVVLQSDGARRLSIEGCALARPEIDGAKVTIFVEEARVGEFTVKSGAAIALSFDVPQEIAARPFVAVRFSADDFAYSADDLRRHVVFRLDRVALSGS